VTVTPSLSGALSERDALAVKTAVALRRAASSYPGAGHFEVTADVGSVEQRENDGALVRFQVKSKWLPVDETGQTSDADFSNEDAHPTRELRWLWPPGSGPVPVAVGLRVTLRVSRSGDVLRVSYTFDEVRAYRVLPDGRWELVVHVQKPAEEKPGKSYFLRIAPRAFDPSGIEVRWTKPHGLLVGEFDDGEYGAAEDEESESAANRRLGWPMANQIDVRVLPGRDGWRRWDKGRFDIFNPASKFRWFRAEVPPSQWWLSGTEAEAVRRSKD